MKSIVLIMFSLLFFGLFSCKSKEYAATNLPETKLEFGSGGGFTGMVTTYTLLENGQLFEAKGINAAPEARPALKKAKVKKAFKALRKLPLDTMQLNKPGNMYKFLHFQEDSTRCEFIWGSAEADVPKEIEAVYKQLTELL